MGCYAMTKPVTGLTQWGGVTTGTTVQLDDNFSALQDAINDLNTYGNYFADSGAANAYVVTLAASLTGALTDGLLIQMKATSANTGASTLNYNGTGVKPIVRLDGSSLAAGDIPASGVVQLQYSSALVSWFLQTPLTASASSNPVVSVRQTVLAGPIDANGYPTVIPASCTSLNLTTANITVTTPLIVSAANGFQTSGGANERIGFTTANLTWSNLTANQVNFLGVVVAANGNLSTVAVGNANGNMPLYQWGGTYSNGNGNYTFNIQEMVMKAGNGNAANQSFTVFVGEANCNGNAVTGGVSYAFMGRYDSCYTQNLPAIGGTVVTVQHNLGVGARDRAFLAENTTADGSYAVGDVIQPTINNAGGPIIPPLPVTRNATSVTSAAGGGTWRTVNKSTGAALDMTVTSWKYKFILSRGW